MSERLEAPAPCGRFAELGELEGPRAAAKLPVCRGTHGKTVQLVTNCFNFALAPTAGIHVYKYTITPECTRADEEQYVLEECWSSIQKEFGVFVVQSPELLFAPKHLQADQTFQAKGCREREFVARTLKITHFRTFDATQVNSGMAGEAEVVFRYIVKKICKPRMNQKVGRRYFNNEDAMEGKISQCPIFAGFFAAMCSSAMSAPRLLLDTAYRPKHTKNVIETLNGVLESSESLDPLATHEPEVQAAWLRRCMSSMVATTYNNRLYRIKAVHFDKTPQTMFTWFLRDSKSTVEMNIAEYVRAYYTMQLANMQQPLLEAYPEKDTETVYLVPELCAFTGFHDELRKDKGLMSEAMRQTKVTPPERFSEIQKIAEGIASSVNATDDGPAAKLMKEWNISLKPQPVEVEGRVLDPLRVYFRPALERDQDKGYLIEDGSFNRSMRNGLQCPAKLEDWLFICPETDTQVVSIWLRSVRDIAQVAFHMKMSEPTRVTVMYENGQEELQAKLKEHVKPTTQLVLLLTPHKDSTQVYRAFKQATCRDYPCITQVVKSETIRKRQSIAAVLSRIVLQINAKFCGPLWQIELRCDETKPAFHRPTMVIGVDVYVSREGEQHMGFSASLDPACTEYYSIAYQLDRGSEKTSLPLRLQEAARDAIVQFAERNRDILPEHVIVYRGSVNPQDWSCIEATEIEALKRVLDATRQAAREENSVQLTFVAVTKRSNIRFFQAVGAPGSRSTFSPVQNPGVGTIIDSDVVRLPDVPNFFLINQSLNKGSAVPTQFVVLYDTGQLPANALQQLTYRLSHLYFNCTCSIRVPAPLQYAKKIAHFVGTALKFVPHKRLLRTLFYL